MSPQTPATLCNLKLFGLPRTFTNWLAYLVDANFRDVRTWHMDVPNWKHGPAHEVDGMDGYLVCVKHPFAWIDSIMRYRRGDPEKHAATWSESNRQYFGFRPSSPGMLIRYEDALSDPCRILDSIAEVFGLERRARQWILTDIYMARGGDKARLLMTTKPFDATHYTERRFMLRFTAEQIVAIRGCLDRDLCAALGYEVEDA